MKALTALALLLVAASANAADILTRWTELTNDAQGNALPTPVDEYRLYDCIDTPIATIPAGTLEYREVGVADTLESGETVCRRVRAYRAPFLGGPADGVFVAIVPGVTTVTTSVVVP